MDSSRTSGTKELINYIKVHSRKYQVCLLMGNDMNIKLNDILYEIEGNFPTRSISFNAMNDTELPKTFDGNTRRTTLFIVMAPLEFSSTIVDNLSAFFNQLSGMRMRQKCLIVLSTRTKLSVEEILLKMWRVAKMLDVTIFKLKEVVIDASKFVSKTRLEATIKNYNPFSNRYREENVSEKCEWFPDKLNDMHGYSVRVAFFNQFLINDVNKPNKNVTKSNENETTSNKNITKSNKNEITSNRNETKSNKNITKLNKNITKSNKNEKIDFMDKINSPILKDLAKTLNFRVDLMLINRDDLNDLNERNVFLLMEENKIDMFPDFLLYGNPSHYQFFEASRPVECIKVCVFVPIQTNKKFTLLFKQFLYLIIMFAILIIILSTLSIILKLDHRFWKPIILIQIILGVSLNYQPDKFVDRIIFGSLIITHAVYSAKIFEALVNIGELAEFEVELETLSDLTNSGLHPMIVNSTKHLIMDSRDGNVLSILNKSDLIKENSYCFQKLRSEKNVACIVSMNGSRMDTILSLRFLDQYGRPSLKALKFYLTEKWMFWSHKSGSIFTDKFDQLMIKLVDFGFYTKYMEFKIRTSYSKHVQDDIQSINQEIFFYFILTIGCCTSSVVFICEVLFAKHCKI